ncbi:small EDRK-rich factor 1 isoform X2 [Erythrolamprus reginae]|uniref:small EDRK-rich factor 1 isoform X2 n=1 Tax=Erythrolamprus reginae TaxID=121349 RepID=UPI00396C88B5
MALFASSLCDKSKTKGGNQRELSRQKNMKKTQEHNKGKRKEDALSASQRKQRDSEIMQQKQKAADEKKTHQGGSK